jgi:hypothetical protein
MANVIKGLYVKSDSIEAILFKTTGIQTDWDKVANKVAATSYKDKLMNEGYYKISDTFNMGRRNPDICFMAWYDAIAEYVLSAANSLLGEKSPVPVIDKTLKSIEKSMLNNPNYADAKASVYESLKKLYPKTYKKRLKLFEQNYNKKVQNGVTEIVKKMLRG